MARSIYDLTDEELEAEFQKAKDELESPEAFEVEQDEVETEEDETLEQPEGDSDGDDDVEESTEDEVDEESETEEGEPDEEPAEEEDDPKAAETEVKTETQPVERRKVKANGREYEFTPDEILEQFPKVFGQAMDYTRKMQALKPWRKTIDAIESAKLNHNDVNLMIDVLKGDKGAVAEILKRTGVDVLDLDDEKVSYKPNDYGRDETTLAIHEVVNEISKDPEYVTTQKILTQEWDEASWQELSKSPDLIRGLHLDVKDGTFERVQAIADVMKLQDRGRRKDLDYYGMAAEELGRRMQAEQMYKMQVAQTQEKAQKIATVQQKQEKREIVKQEAPRRKAASIPKKAAPKQISFDDTDEGFEEWYKSLQDKM